MHQHPDICKLVINNLLQANADDLFGKACCREKPYDGRYSRWGYNPGSLKVCNQKLSIDVPRLYDCQQHKSFNVSVYDQMKKQAVHSEEMASGILHGIILRKSVLKFVGFLDERFETVEMAWVEWLHRAVFNGVLIKPVDNLLLQSSVPSPAITDELLLVRLRWNKAWFIYLLIRYFIMGRLGLRTAFACIRSFWRAHPDVKSNPVPHPGWRNQVLTRDYPVSVIIPTVERYPYLVTVLNHLRGQTLKPKEVIVIDQTQAHLRQTGFVADFDDIGLIYLTQETAGQCTSRNQGLLKSTGDYILFIDDDVELKPDVIEDHLKSMEYFDADVSCGVCDEAGALPIPPEFNLIRHSDVLPTNNGMVRRSALRKSGLFDLAFDKGQRADGELGARLYKSGARLILNPEIRVLHHRAPRGGLRKHQVRKVTYATSRKYITHFRLPHTTEIYLNKLHFSETEQREVIVLSLLGCFSIRGGFIKKLLKTMFGILMFPALLIEVYNRSKVARKMIKQYPQIDYL